MNKNKINRLFARFCEAEPHPKTELVSTNDFTLLVSIVLSAQATDAGVNKATPPLFKIAATPQKMARLGAEKIRDYIKSINFNNTKARNVAALSEQLVERYGGVIPETLAELQTLPGVGRKTASVWLNNARGAGYIAVDTHVFRVSNRLRLCRTKTADETADTLERIIPDQWKPRAHHWLILHGRYVCKARVPECWRCLVVDLCEYKAKNLTPPKTATPKLKKPL